MVLDLHCQVVCAGVLMHLAPAVKLSVVVTAKRFIQLCGAGCRTPTDGYSTVHERYAHFSPWTNHPLTKVFILSQRHLTEIYRSEMRHVSLVLCRIDEDTQARFADGTSNKALGISQKDA